MKDNLQKHKHEHRKILSIKTAAVVIATMPNATRCNVKYIIINLEIYKRAFKRLHTSANVF